MLFPNDQSTASFNTNIYDYGGRDPNAWREYWWQRYHPTVWGDNTTWGNGGGYPTSMGANQFAAGGVNQAMNAYNSLPGMYGGISGAIGSGLRAAVLASRQRQLQASYQQEQAQAKAENIQRMNQIGGYNEYWYHGAPLNIAGNAPKGHYKTDTSPAGIAKMNAEIGAASNYAPEAGGYYGARARAMTDVDNLEKSQAAGYDDLVRGYQQRARQVGQMGNAAFLQDRNDINYDMAKQQSTALADAASRGLSGSTVAESIRQNMAGEKARALGNVTDRMMQNRMATAAQMSGDVLGARQQALANQNQLARLRMATDQSTTGDLLRFATGVNNSYPNPYLLAQLSQQLGRGAYASSYPGYY